MTIRQLPPAPRAGPGPPKRRPKASWTCPRRSSAARKLCCKILNCFNPHPQKALSRPVARSKATTARKIGRKALKTWNPRLGLRAFQRPGRRECGPHTSGAPLDSSPEIPPQSFENVKSAPVALCPAEGSAPRETGGRREAAGRERQAALEPGPSLHGVQQPDPAERERGQHAEGEDLARDSDPRRGRGRGWGRNAGRPCRRCSGRSPIRRTGR